MSDHQPQGVGATGGLPGANADPRASELTDDEQREALMGTEPATPTGVEDVDGAYAGEGIDPAYDEDRTGTATSLADGG